MAIKEGKIIAVTSVKGGVGKTTTVLNLAAAFNKKVLIVDLDLYGSAIASSLDVKPRNNIFELIDDLENKRFSNIESYITMYNENIDILAAPNDPRKATKLNTNFLNMVFYQLKVKYDIILIDTNHIIDETNLVTFDLADEILYIISPNLIDFRNLQTILNIYKSMDKENYKVILNKSKEKNQNYYDNKEISVLIKDNVDYIIPKDFYCKDFEKYLNEGEILYNKWKKHKIFNKITESLEGGN